MIEDFSKSISKSFPPHPHRRAHFLLGLLALVLVGSSIYFYNLTLKEETVTPAPVVQTDPSKLTEAQRQKILYDLQAKASSTPPLSTAERSKILKEIQTSLKKK